MLAKKYNSSKHDPTSWLMSFKIDGIRAYWDGEKLLTRGNNIIHAPAWFTEPLKGVPCHLDGELVFTSHGSPIGNFQETCSVVKRHNPDERWKNVRYFVFDAPNLDGFTFDIVYDNLKQLALPDYVEVVEQTVIQSKESLQTFHDEYTAIGGEGVMIRNPNSRYERKRSKNILKVKIFEDAEATVIDHLPGKGRHEGRLGGCICTWTDERNERTFHVGVGFTDAERDNPPKIGDIITFEYFGLTDGGAPRHPKYLRPRLDYE
jgi:DNA ligase-1